MPTATETSINGLLNNSGSITARNTYQNRAWAFTSSGTTFIDLSNNGLYDYAFKDGNTWDPTTGQWQPYDDPEVEALATGDLQWQAAFQNYSNKTPNNVDDH